MTKPLPPFKRRLFTVAGIACLLLGTLGIFIPVLPTTPFLLMAAGLFLRSSDRLYKWITTHRIFGPFILNFYLYHAVPHRSKIAGIVLLWLTIGSSLIWAVDAWWLQALLLLVGAAVTVHLARMRTLTPAMLSEIAARDAAPAEWEEQKLTDSSGL